MENRWLFPQTCPTAAIDANERAVTWCVAYSQCEKGSAGLIVLCVLVEQCRVHFEVRVSHAHKGGGV